MSRDKLTGPLSQARQTTLMDAHPGGSVRLSWAGGDALLAMLPMCVVQHGARLNVVAAQRTQDRRVSLLRPTFSSLGICNSAICG